jgi:hypothetical protein
VQDGAVAAALRLEELDLDRFCQVPLIQARDAEGRIRAGVRRYP